MTERQLSLFKALYWIACIVVLLWPFLPEIAPFFWQKFYLGCQRTAYHIGKAGIDGEKRYHTAVERVSYL